MPACPAAPMRPKARARRRRPMPKTAVNFAFHSSLVVVTRFSVSDIEFRAETIRVMPAKARQPVPPRRWLRLEIEGQRLLGPCMLDLPPFAIIRGAAAAENRNSLFIPLDTVHLYFWLTFAAGALKSLRTTR